MPCDAASFLFELAERLFRDHADRRASAPAVLGTNQSTEIQEADMTNILAVRAIMHIIATPRRPIHAVLTALSVVAVTKGFDAGKCCYLSRWKDVIDIVIAAG